MKFTAASTLLSTAILTATFSPLTLAAKEQPEYTGWSWSANVDSLNITKDAASREYIDPNAVVFGFAAEHYTSANEFTYAIGLNFISYDDQYGFSQQTNYGTKKSDASAMMAYVEAGPRYKFGVNGMNFLSIKGGISGIFSSQRGISYCSNCYSEDINVDGGFYGAIGVGHSFDSFDLSLNFHQYFTGDLDNSIGIKLSSSF